jgi:hypothetical protein
VKLEAPGPCKDHDAAARHKLSAAAGETLATRPKDVEPLKVAEDGSYTVQRGDSMWSIARRSLAVQKQSTDEQSTYREMRRLAALNGVDVDKCGSILRAGVTISIVGDRQHIAHATTGHGTGGRQPADAETHGTGGRKPADSGHGTGGRQPAIRESDATITQPGRWDQSGWVGEVEPQPQSASAAQSEQASSGPQPCTEFRPVVFNGGINRAENCTSIYAGSPGASVTIRPGAEVILNPGVRGFAYGGHVTALDDTTVIAGGGTIIASPYARIMPVGDRAVIGIDPSLAAPRTQQAEQSAPSRSDGSTAVRTGDGSVLRTADGTVVRTRTDAEIEAERLTP